MNAIIFEMDDVLVDVSNSYIPAVKQTAEYILNREVNIGIITRLRNRGTHDYVELARKVINLGGKVAEPDEVEERLCHFYWGKKENGLVLNENWLFSYDNLRKLYGRYKLGILTSRPRKDAEFALKRFTARTFFDFMASIDDVQGKVKPNPIGLHLALKHFDTKDAVLVGNSIEDIEMAKLMNIPCICIASDVEMKSTLLGKGAKAVLDSVNELPEALHG